MTTATTVQWGVRCYRSSLSALGASEAWLQNDNGAVLFAEEASAITMAKTMNDHTTSKNVGYVAERYS